MHGQSTIMMSDRRKCPVPRGPKLDTVLMMTHRLMRKREAGILGKPHSELNVTALNTCIFSKSRGQVLKHDKLAILIKSFLRLPLPCVTIYWQVSRNVSVVLLLTVEQDADQFKELSLYSNTAKSSQRPSVICMP